MSIILCPPLPPSKIPENKVIYIYIYIPMPSHPRKKIPENKVVDIYIFIPMLSPPQNKTRCCTLYVLRIPPIIHL